MSPTQQRAIIVEAYKLLLHLPVSSVTRLNVQTALASLRDEIARLDAMSPEAVQTKYESLVT